MPKKNLKHKKVQDIFSRYFSKFICSSEHYRVNFEKGISTGFPSEAISEMHSQIRMGLGTDPCTMVISYFFSPSLTSSQPTRANYFPSFSYERGVIQNKILQLSRLTQSQHHHQFCWVVFHVAEI